MSDSCLRDLERKALQTGASSDYEAWRNEAKRCGGDFPFVSGDDFQYEVFIRRSPMCVSSASRFYGRQEGCFQPLSRGRERFPSIQELILIDKYLEQRPWLWRTEIAVDGPFPREHILSRWTRGIASCVGIAYTPRVERFKVVRDISFLIGTPTNSGYVVDFENLPGTEYKSSEGYFERTQFLDQLHNPVLRELVGGDLSSLADIYPVSVEHPFPDARYSTGATRSLLCGVQVGISQVENGWRLSLRRAGRFDHVLLVRKKLE